MKENSIDENQHKMKIARTQDWYDSIWKTVGKCVFCDLKDKYILHEENGIVLTINIYPYIDGQMMAIPRRHVSSPKELTQLEWNTMRKMSYLAKKLIRRAHGHKGMWSLIREGGEVANMTVTDHLHMQLIPFDSPDLCKWNYRDLKFTPLENVKKYKKLANEFSRNLKKFDIKYSFKTELPIICDVIIKDSKSRVLFEKRKKVNKIEGRNLTLPGGHIDEPTKGLTEGLLNEVKEETGLSLSQKELKILDSRVSKLNFIHQNKFIKHKVEHVEEFLWNTYVYNAQVNSRDAKPGDDCAGIVWLSIEEIKKSEDISAEVKKVISLLVE